jgi:hypothetical protein
VTFDFTPHGWTDYIGDHPDSGRSCSTWMEPQFRERAKADYATLEVLLPKLTKLQLARFLRASGKLDWLLTEAAVAEYARLNRKDDLVRSAHIAQYGAWYPYIELVDSDRRVGWVRR